MRKIQIGDVIQNGYASETNPLRVSIVTHIGSEITNCVYPHKGLMRKSRYYTRDLRDEDKPFKIIGHVVLGDVLERELNSFKKGGQE